jgi:CheY-like chemotaxis protein
MSQRSTQTGSTASAANRRSLLPGLGVLITAFPNDRDQAHALRSGSVGYLTKPFNETELLTLIHSILKYPKND